MPTFGASCFGHFSVAECAEVSVSTLQAQLDSYICTETLPQADPTSVANAVGTVTLVREGGISAFESLHPLLTIQKKKTSAGETQSVARVWLCEGLWLGFGISTA